MKKGQEYKAKIRKGVAVGSALLLGTSVGESAGGKLDVSPSAADLAAIQKGPTYTSVDFSAAAGTTQLVNVSMPPEASFGNGPTRDDFANWRPNAPPAKSPQTSRQNSNLCSNVAACTIWR